MNRDHTEAIIAERRHEFSQDETDQCCICGNVADGYAQFADGAELCESCAGDAVQS